MSGISFRKRIIEDNLRKGLENQHLLNDWEREFIADLYKKVEKGYLRPDQFTQNQFNRLQSVVEGIK